MHHHGKGVYSGTFSGKRILPSALAACLTFFSLSLQER
jgi:hypothetical protein